MRSGIACILVTVGGLVALTSRPVIGQDGGATVSDTPGSSVLAVPSETLSNPSDATPGQEPDVDAAGGTDGPIVPPDRPSQKERGGDPVIRPIPGDLEPGPLRWRERMQAPTPYPPPTFFGPHMQTPARVRVLTGWVGSPFYLGVSLQPVGEALRSHLKLDPDVGLIVEGIAVDSPAAEVLQEYDVLTGVDDHSIKQHDDLVQAVQKAGSEKRELKLNLIRGGQAQTVTVRTAQRTERELIFRSESIEGGAEETVREWEWIPIPSEPAERVLPSRQRPGAEWFEQYRREQNELRQLIDQLRRDVNDLRGVEPPSEP